MSFLKVSIVNIMIVATFTSYIPTGHAQSYQIDFSKRYISEHSGPAKVKNNAFGSIYTTFLTLGNYEIAASQTPISYLRYPGGTFAEQSTEVYSLTFPDIYLEPAPGESNYDKVYQKGLTEVLAYTVKHNESFSMVLPTVRYLDDVSQGQADIEIFLTRLLRGDFGLIPKDFTLEIGNESAHYGWSNGVFTPGVGSYGYLANRMLTTIRKTLDNPNTNPNNTKIKVALQLSTTVGGQHSIFTQITKQNLKTVDGFIRHSGLVEQAASYNLAFENNKLRVAKKYWNEAWGKNVPQFKVYDTAWEIGSSNHVNEMVNYNGQDVGARQAGAVVEVFSKLIAGGSDKSAMWGVQENVSSNFFYKGKTISHGGAAFKMMAESLSGAELLSGKVDAQGNWIKTDKNYDVIGFKKNNNQMVIFITAGDIPEAGLDVDITLSNFGRIKTAIVTKINTEAFTTDGNRLSELPVVSNTTVKKSKDSLTYHVSQDFEVARIIVTKK